MIARGRELIRLPHSQEIKPNMIELMKMKATFLQSEIQDGDIVCFQVEMQEPESVELATCFFAPVS